MRDMYEMKKRYLNDPHFNALVDNIVSLLLKGDTRLDDWMEALVLAVQMSLIEGYKRFAEYGEERGRHTPTPERR